MYLDAFKRFPVIETTRLMLRALRPSDLEDMYEYAQNRAAFAYTDGFPHEKEDLRQMIDVWAGEAYESKLFIRWAIVLKEENKVIGGIYLFAPRGNDEIGWCMDIGYEVSHLYTSRGIASEAINALARFAMDQMGLVRIQAQVLPENLASVRACEKAGFIREGLLRKYLEFHYPEPRMLDVVMLSCTPGDVPY